MNKSIATSIKIQTDDAVDVQANKCMNRLVLESVACSVENFVKLRVFYQSHEHMYTGLRNEQNSTR